ETFFLNLSSAYDATIADAQGVGTILEAVGRRHAGGASVGGGRPVPAARGADPDLPAAAVVVEDRSDALGISNGGVISAAEVEEERLIGFPAGVADHLDGHRHALLAGEIQVIHRNGDVILPAAGGAG